MSTAIETEELREEREDREEDERDAREELDEEEQAKAEATLNDAAETWWQTWLPNGVLPKHVIVAACGLLVLFSIPVIIFACVAPATAGQFGDVFGSANALFTGFALLGAVTAVVMQAEQIRMQRRELRLQRHEMKLQRRETRRQRHEHRRQRRALRESAEHAAAQVSQTERAAKLQALGQLYAATLTAAAEAHRLATAASADFAANNEDKNIAKEQRDARRTSLAKESNVLRAKDEQLQKDAALLRQRLVEELGIELVSPPGGTVAAS